ncbi:hypothetical protein SAMN04490248_10376 [Salinihabitans flavidus]|uniref:Uncharacterized protein n=1 Tax=Salinihabitans flavidus TaxID=569882 RepID=A0A1H8NA05_9RHOB|nr:hypothetical protein SAMN04490248_10376 [Salinihabitans flavidus]
MRDGLIAVGVADEIRKNCPTISARLFRALRYLHGLENHAKKLGYSQDEIDAYVDDKAEEKRLRAIGADYMRARGVVEDDAKSYCALGRAEIEKSSQIGALLRAK